MPKTLTCRNGHSVTTSAKGGQAIICPVCRRAGERVNVWVPVEHAPEAAPASEPVVATSYVMRKRTFRSPKRSGRPSGPALPTVEGPCDVCRGPAVISLRSVRGQIRSYCRGCLGRPVSVPEPSPVQARSPRAGRVTTATVTLPEPMPARPPQPKLGVLLRAFFGSLDDLDVFTPDD